MPIVSNSLWYARFFFLFMSWYFSWSKLFDFSFRLLLILLPFTVFLTVFSQFLWFSGWSLYKELVLIFMGIILWFDCIQKRRFPKIGILDWMIGGYIVYLIFISLFTTGIQGIIYGGRYDFEFIIAFWILYHGAYLLPKNFTYYLKIFLLSWGWAIFLGFCVRFIFGEDILLYFWFSWNPSSWQFGSSVPIFHGIDTANIRRFQGIFDGPNSAAAFILLYIGIFVYFLRTKKDWHFLVGVWVFFLLGLLFLTYSRSWMIGFFVWFISVVIFSFSTLYKKYRFQSGIVGILALFIFGILFLRYGWAWQGAITVRAWSSKWHIERMVTGWNNFIEQPWGHGLWFAGPGYRYLIPDMNSKNATEVEILDRKYIPESWFIQQLEEGGVIALFLFLAIMTIIAYHLLQIHSVLFGMFISILCMNFFLHTFESAYFSLLLFLLIGLVLGKFRKS